MKNNILQRTGYAFFAFSQEQSIILELFFVDSNRVRLLGSQQHTPTQKFGEYLSPPGKKTNNSLSQTANQDSWLINNILSSEIILSSRFQSISC